MFSTENVLAKPLCSGLSGVRLRCVVLWGNVAFNYLHVRFCSLKKYAFGGETVRQLTAFMFDAAGRDVCRDRR